ncbi:hypothetical protein DIE21_17140 [Burkholderia sp. Bp9140]|uniref:hypothetical protein n=1 Tax=Burkholderia sp. Bp9140 TaxID=2184572 RepID=UPI000F573319|nr:hypothetical protein [Burkholderia sp. Bp9140]RQR50485.1 hypothetical protein DIE21_17140 [Burkholderia sp. Bp9140]
MKAKAKYLLSVLFCSLVYAALLSAWTTFSLDGARHVLLAWVWCFIALTVAFSFYANPKDVRPAPSILAFEMRSGTRIAVGIVLIWYGDVLAGALFIAAALFMRAIKHAAQRRHRVAMAGS